MFGGAFVAFRTRGVHFFDEDGEVYRELARVLAVRRGWLALRRGRQYLREISGDGVVFGLPHTIGGEMRSLVAWSRILADDELLVVVNTDPLGPRSAHVTIEYGLHQVGSKLQCLYSSDPTRGGELTADGIERRTVEVELGPAGVAVYG